MSCEDREKAMRKAYGEAVASGKRSLNAENCFAPFGDCSGKIIRAHTISKCHGLRRIAKDGEVYQVKADPYAERYDELMKMSRRGVSAVSTFRGFCARHDAEIFDPIENHEFAMTKEQVFLLMFRTVAKELFLKKIQQEGITQVMELEAAKAGASVDQLRPTAFGQIYEDGVGLGVDELHVDKQRMDRMLVERDFSEIEYCVVRCGRTPSLVCSGYYSPFFDFGGDRLQQDSQVQRKLNSLYCNVIAKNRGGWIILAYFKDEADGPRQLIQSLLSTGQPDAAAAWLAMVHFENSAYGIDWWDALPGEVRKRVLTTFRDVANPLSPVENQLRRMIMQGFVNWEPGPAKWLTD